MARHARCSLTVLALGVAASRGPASPPASPRRTRQPLPRFRAGASLVRLDAYVSANGAAVTDLTVDDFEVFEDDTPQKVESFELIRAREATGETPTRPVDAGLDAGAARRGAGSQRRGCSCSTWTAGTSALDGSSRSAAPVEAFLDKVVGPNDLVGVMTPDITPQNMTLVRKGAGIDRVLRDVWYWGERDRLNTSDPREEASRPATRMRARPRDREGDGRAPARAEDAARARRPWCAIWMASARSASSCCCFGRLGAVPPQRSARPAAGRTRCRAALEPVGVGTDGRLTTAGGGAAEGDAGLDACERERVMLAYIDHELEVRQMAQRANRANVSFYPLDPRGLTAFDDSIGGAFRPSSLDTGSSSGWRSRQDGLKVLAEQTDGAWILNTNDTAGALTRILADTNSYYLLSYYSTNPKLDGRFRRITVRVKRPDMEVRARPGYLAPTEAEARAAGATLARRARARRRGWCRPACHGRST